MSIPFRPRRQRRDQPRCPPAARHGGPAPPEHESRPFRDLPFGDPSALPGSGPVPGSGPALPRFRPVPAFRRRGSRPDRPSSLGEPVPRRWGVAGAVGVAGPGLRPADPDVFRRRWRRRRQTRLHRPLAAGPRRPWAGPTRISPYSKPAVSTQKCAERGGTGIRRRYEQRSIVPPPRFAVRVHRSGCVCCHLADSHTVGIRLVLKW